MARPGTYKTLRSQLVLAIVPLLLVFMVFNFVIIVRHEEDILRHETEKRALSLADALAFLAGEQMRTFSFFQLEKDVEQFMRLEDVAYVMILGKDGEVIAHSEPSERGKREMDPDTRSAVAAEGQRVQFTVYRGLPVLDASAPVMVDRRQGTVRVGLRLDSLNRALDRSRRYLSGLTLLLLSGSVLFMGVITRRFTEPLLRLALVARDLARGKLTARASSRRRDEVGLLGRSLNLMAEQLQDRIQLEKAARERLQYRVKTLLDFTERVMEGDLTGQAPVGEDDEMGQLAMGVNETVRHLRILLEEERSMRRDLEVSRQELQRVNEKLKELDKLKSEFLNTVSHELRTPLTSIKAFAEILLDNRGEDIDTQMEFLEIINKESDRLTRLINNLLDLSRIEAGRMQWDMEPVDIYEVINAAANSLRGAADKKGLVFEVLAETKLPMTGDRDKLIQVLTNLIGNAIKFTPPGGRVRLLASRTPSNQVEVVVEDSGIGIAPEHHQRIFEKFGQVDSSETREIKGTGLGLPIARSIVEAHQGTLTVDSQLGRGSRFIVRLPLEDDAPLPVLTLPRHRLADWGLGRRVLVVDDEVNIRRFLRHVLELEGYQVLEARTGDEAITLARQDKPDLICLDVMLPDVNGMEVLTRLKQEPATRDIPVMIISIVEDEAKLFRLGAADFLAKPVDKDKLLERIIRLMAWSNRQENEILLVDDDPDILLALNTIFLNRGYRVRTAQNGEEALQSVREHPPDLILLDLKMPGVSGHDVMRELKHNPETANIPIVVLTAAPRDDRTVALGMGANTILTKPFSEGELASLVRNLLTETALSPGGDESATES
ncbi:MAG: hypothetical protein AMXMBFR33_42280 [Candidatus Xenobia bacterium]